MRSPEERLARLLDRHPEFYAVASDEPTGAIIRRGELLVPAQHVGRVEETAREWTDRRIDLEPIGGARFRLRRDADVTDLIATRLTAGEVPMAAPIHLFRGEPNYQGGPGGPPSPVATPPTAPGQAARGHATTVAVLDTGLDARHPWFPRSSWEAVDDDVEDRLDTDNDYELDAQAGHGTFIAGIVRRHAPGAHLLVGRVLGSDGVCDEVDLLDALRRLQAAGRSRKRRVDVLNLSLGAYTWNDRPPAMLARTLADLAADTVVVAAAGNNGSDRVFWPAAFPGVVGVGAVAADGRGPAAFSNRGSWVRVWAPGEGVASSFVTFDGPEDERPGADIDADCFTGFATWSGTSFATPHVAGALAARAQEQRTSPKAVLDEVLAQMSAPPGGAADGSGPP